MIKIKIDNGLIVEGDDPKLKAPIVRQFLKDDWRFVEESGIFRRSEESTPAAIEQIVLFLKEFFKDLEIDSTIQNHVEQRQEKRREIHDQRQEAINVKALIEQGENKVPDLKIPRLVNGPLYWYQRLGVQHALTIGNSANFSVPGSGKTWMGYSVFFVMKDEQKIVDKLLVCYW